MGPKPDIYFEELIDARIGGGQTREVFAVKDRDDVVIKRMRIAFPMTNLIEWLIWHAVQKMGEDIIGNTPNKEMKDLFAACMEISETGKYLMMERLGTIGAGTPIAKGNFPDWLNDKKDDAFGQSRDGKVKVLDYGMVNFYSALNPLNNRSMFGG